MSTDTSKSASTMAELMARQKSTFVTLHKSQTVKGKVTKLTRSEILLDIDAKTEAVVLEKEKKLLHSMLSLLKIGDVVEATVLNPESDTGNAVVSLRKFLDDRVWERLTQVQKNHEKIDVTVRDVTKGGYIVETSDGLDGFLPNSNISVKQDTQHLVGKKLSVMIGELHRETRKFILSQKQVFGQEDFGAIIKKIKIGQKITAIISHITSFGIFLSIPLKGESAEELFVDGFIHISEVAWEKVTDLSEMFTVGDTIEAVVVGYDTNAKRIDLSIKRLMADPFDEIAKQFSIDKKVTGVVTKITETGIVINLGNEEQIIEGFARREKIPPTMKFETGQKVAMTVSQIDTKNHRILLTPVLLEKPLTYR